MTKLIRTATASLVALTIGTAGLTVPATAGGSVSFSIAPGNTQDAQALRAGLQMYSLYNGIKNGGIKQRGSGNIAGLLQNGGGNLGIIHQEGSGHNGTVQQNGSGNSYGLFQFGRNTSGHAVQNGNGRTGATIQFGW